jgi:CRP-like cAMP-binding protein
MVVGERVTGALSQCPVFYGRPIHALVPTCAMHRYADRQAVFGAGDRASHLIVLVSGRVETFALRLNGDENPVARYRAPDAVVDVGIFASDRRRRLSARADGAVEAILVPHDSLLRAAADDAVLTERLLTAIADANGAASATAAGADVTERVLGCLRLLADAFGVRQPDGSVLIGLRLSNADLGGLVAAPRPDVGTALKTLEAAGHVERLGDYYLLIP